VIEHVPKSSPILNELDRVLTPGGRLVLGTPDYARREWTTLEAIYGRVAPGGYAEEHISHYTKEELVVLFEARGYRLEATRYILRGELILALRKLPVPRAMTPSSNGHVTDQLSPTPVGAAIGEAKR
jgi:SAM-dependent methyltransferase